ncbi:hypothetical protein [Clostridium sp. YIM B02506]|uniref:hypothetical protein n=1 Tax=Clostridium sp. YIM B02506 TaxID=2910680 RepID=UPI001EEDC449|nr:hypothetical protein [Clostridium sp. YIM B02506]
MKRGLDDLKKKAQKHPFYNLDIDKRAEVVAKEFEDYDDKKAPYKLRREALLDMRGETW